MPCSSLPPIIERPSCIAVDQSDDNLLNNIRGAYKDSSSHCNIFQLVGNLLCCGNPNRNPVQMNIFGHGRIGAVSAGAGADICTTDHLDCIDIQFKENWINLIPRLKGATKTLVFWSCDTGAEDAGADLLFTLAQQLNVQVMSPTGQLEYNNGLFSLPEPGACWQVVIPARERPSPVGIPYRTPKKPAQDVAMRIMHNLVWHDIPLPKILSLDFYPSAFKSDHVRVRKDQEEKILSLFDLSDPAAILGNLASHQTGRLAFNFENEPSKRFLIHNDRLLQDEANSTIYYFGFEGIIEAVREVRRSLI